MIVVFLTNYYNHHQKYLADAMYSLLDGDYFFIETEKISEERLNMGWGNEKVADYVVNSGEFWKNRARWQNIIDEADVVIIGSAPSELTKNRIKKGRIVFRYSERPLKEKNPLWKLPVRLFTWRMTNPQKKNVYMLSASAFTSADYGKFLLYRNKCYKWGYFPKTKKYDDVKEMISSKTPASILWVARMIPLKHPEKALEVARRLKAEGYTFTLNMIGNGVLEEQIRNNIMSYNLSDCVKLLGVMNPEEVRAEMEKSEVFLFTSDRNEGWGAVLNESMNSACAVIASHAIGSVPFLISDGDNGLIYNNDDINDLYNKVKKMLDNVAERQSIGEKAYYTIVNEWNAENAAKKFLALSKTILSGKTSPDEFDAGVCSKAKRIKDNWYKNEDNK